MTTIRELAERYWQGDIDLVREHHPVQPALARVGEEIAEGVYCLKSLASINVLDTGDGLVMLDTGGPFDTDHVFDSVRSWRPAAPLRAAVFSHHHIDHVFGVARFEIEAAERDRGGPVVYGHAAMPEHFERYERTLAWNSAINQRQFGLPVDGFRWPASWRYPDVTYEDRLAFKTGNLTFELYHARGETEDATWTWVPELKILHSGDLFLWTMPNAGNPQKVQRYVSDWAAALRRMAEKGAEILLPGHGMPIFGAGRIAAALADTAEALDSIETQTLGLMNTGASLDRIIHDVQVPAHLRDKPYLQPVYDHPQFLVRNVWRRYGGWYDGEPDNLLPAPRLQQAREWVELAGGVNRVLKRARELADKGDFRMACHFVEYAVIAAPKASEAHEIRAKIYAERSAACKSFMARNLFLHASESSKHHKRDLAGDW